MRPSWGGAVIGVGLDLVDIERFREVLARRPSMHARLFTDGERALAAGRADPIPALAARFAAKEAVMKALGVGLGAFSFQEVEVLRLESGAPELRVTGAAAVLAEDRGVTAWHISLSHSVADRWRRGQRALSTARRGLRHTHPSTPPGASSLGR